MSRVISRAMLNSAVLTGNAILNAVLNFLTILVLTWLLATEEFGAYVSAQAKVAVWLLLVDLGLYNGLISTLTFERSRGGGTSLRALVVRVLFLRLVGATVGFFVIFRLASHEAAGNTALLWQNLAFTPFLFGYGIHQTFTAYLAFKDEQVWGVYGHLVGTVLSTSAAIYLALHGAGVATVLFAQSLAPFVSAAWICLKLPNFGPSVRKRGDKDAWRKLFFGSWPFAILFAATTLWQRLDQIVAAELFGLAKAAEYGLTARLVGIPILMTAGVSVALFPDFQRTGVDAPEKLRFYVGAILKWLTRYGLVLSFVVIGGVALVMAALFPKYRSALGLLPWFAPGIWAFWLFNFANGGLLGLRSHREAVFAHVAGLTVYLLALFTLPKAFGLVGVALAYDVFCFTLFIGTYVCFQRTKGQPLLGIFGAFNAEERRLFSQIWQKALRRTT